MISHGLLPSAWGEVQPELKVTDPHLQLTETEKAQVQIATGLKYDAELLRDVLYAEPLAIEQQQRLHASLEGFCYGMPRLQALLGDDTEQKFLDYDYHYGPVEYLQLVSEDAGKSYVLEHFYHTVANAQNKQLTTVPQAFTKATIASSTDFAYGLRQPQGIYSGNHYETNKIINGQVHGQWFIYIQAPTIEQNYLLLRQMSAKVSPQLDPNLVTEPQWKMIPIASLLPPAFQGAAVLSVNRYYDANTNPYLCVMLDNLKDNTFHYLLLYLNSSTALSLQARFIAANQLTDQPLWLIDVYPAAQANAGLHYAFSNAQGKQVLTFVEPATAHQLVIDGVQVTLKTCQSPSTCPNLFPLFSGKLTAIYEVASQLAFKTPIPAYQGCTAKAKVALINGTVYALLTCDTAPPGKAALVGTFLAFYPLTFPGNTNNTIAAFYGSRNKYGSYAFYALRNDGTCFITRESLAHSTLEDPYAPPLKTTKTVASGGGNWQFYLFRLPGL